jgi:hypothetical protein
MTHKIICTENYLLIVDDSQITEGDWYFWKVTNSVQKAKKDSLDRLPTSKDGSSKIIAHLPLNGASILDWVNTLPSLPDEAKDWARSQWSCEPDDYEDLYYDGLEMGYNAAKEKYVQLIEKQISDFTHDLRESTSNYIKQNCEGALFGLKRLRQSLQQPKMPIGFNLEAKDTYIKNGILVKTEWVGMYTY